MSHAKGDASFSGPMGLICINSCMLSCLEWANSFPTEIANCVTLRLPVNQATIHGHVYWRRCQWVNCLLASPRAINCPAGVSWNVSPQCGTIQCCPVASKVSSWKAEAFRFPDKHVSIYSEHFVRDKGPQEKHSATCVQQCAANHALIRLRSLSSMVQVMAWRLPGAKPLPETMMTCYWLDP